MALPRPCKSHCIWKSCCAIIPHNSYKENAAHVFARLLVSREFLIVSYVGYALGCVYMRVVSHTFLKGYAGVMLKCTKRDLFVLGSRARLQHVSWHPGITLFFQHRTSPYLWFLYCNIAICTECQKKVCITFGFVFRGVYLRYECTYKPPSDGALVFSPVCDTGCRLFYLTPPTLSYLYANTCGVGALGYSGATYGSSVCRHV